MDILDSFGIEPYSYLGVEITDDRKTVKNKYKKMAKQLHPDKNQGKTDIEFKLLYLSYKHILSKCVDAPSSTFEQLKNENREEVAYQKSFHEINFEDPETRKMLFADDDINLEEFKKEIERVNGLSTSYSSENFYKKEVLDAMKTNGKFDREKFNAFFIKLKKDNKIENQLVKKEVVPANMLKEYVNVNSYDGMIVNSINKRKGNYSRLLKEKKITNNDIENFKKIDKSELHELTKEQKRDTGKISKKDLRKLQEKAGVKIPVNTRLSFEESKLKMMQDKIKNINKLQEEQKEYVMKNKRIFQNSLCYRERT